MGLANILVLCDKLRSRLTEFTHETQNLSDKWEMRGNQTRRIATAVVEKNRAASFPSSILTQLSTSLHAHRVARRHRHHRDSGGDAVAGLGSGQEESANGQLHFKS